MLNISLKHIISFDKFDKENVPLLWTEEYQNSLNNLKQYLHSSPILFNPDYLNHTICIVIQVSMAEVAF